MNYYMVLFALNCMYIGYDVAKDRPIHVLPFLMFACLIWWRMNSRMKRDSK